MIKKWGMKMERRTALDMEKIARFISRLNVEAKHHVGYVGTQKDEIEASIREEFVQDGNADQLITVAYENDDIIGVLGLNADDESNVAEIWGPYVDGEEEAYLRVAPRLWEEGVRKLAGNVKAFHGFYNRENKNAQKLMASLGAEKRNAHMILKRSRPDRPYPSDGSVSAFTTEYMRDFVQLHDAVFPNTYYSGAEIISRLNENNKLFIYRKDDKLGGYCYVEGNPEHQEGSVEYIAVSDSFRAQGIGKSLLHAGLNHLFMELNTAEISICVELGNERAIGLYQAAGFEEEHVLYLYHVK
ncbi:N-acetyltransferase [Paenibacillus sp. FSL M8-0334]|uniref:GNAT family N-acetyltransferase n=2 Tax=Paenibacillus TaxID=44249 RepID=A0ABW9T6N9_9BACL|nr:N-acetyltransferase [Paenibacillus campinasensis]MUG68557.1 GNAT family N-acetyltransferase [Paenibacillus campinasensis]PAK55959.1 hypothetical protein CHH75_01495 [Paenibacillus sp. 7541]